MKNFRSCIIFLLLSAVFTTGCIALVNDPVTPEKSGNMAEASAIPAAAEDPVALPEKKAVVQPPAAENVKKEVKQELPPPPEKKIVPPAPRHEKPVKKSGDSPRSPENYRRGPGVWRAFSRLSRQEQEELLKLQRNDPKKFEAVMREKADQLYEAEKQRRKEQHDLAMQYQQESDPAKKEAIKADLRKKIHEDFLQRLQDSRRDIESHKRRTAQLEEELLKREKNCEAIVDALLQHHLQKYDAKMEKGAVK